MRNAFAGWLHERAAVDARVCLVTGDLGYSVLEKFQKSYPDRFINAGVAEQNMTGLAAGLALCGWKPFVYSIVNFTVVRCLEQIRNDVCYHNADVCMVSVGGGLSYGTAGYTHWGVEDVSFMRNLPNMEVFTPCDVVELRACLAEISGRRGPTYLRLGKGGEPVIHSAPLSSTNLVELMPPAEANLVAAGPILAEALDAANQLRKEGLSVGLFSLPHMSSSGATALRSQLLGRPWVVSVEEHLASGGLGSFVAESLSGAPAAPRLQRLGIKPECLHAVGSQAYLRKLNGIDADTIVKRVRSLVQGVE